MHSLPGHEFHFVVEVIAYFVAARIYWSFARAERVVPSAVDRLCMLAGAVFGAAVGSKALHVLEHLPVLLAQNELGLWLGGKSVLGGFMGGTLGVEVVKKWVGWRAPTGDAWVPAMAAGLMIGRIGCQFSGLWDLTYGSPTSLPWAWDYGDGIGRHPTGLYEIILVGALFALVWTNRRLREAPGARFAAFLMGYCAIRFALDFLKPPFSPAAAGTLPAAMYGGLSAIQWAAVLGFGAYLLLLRHRLAVAK
jgi:phosphatidylglycerol---prolipoprotein diacylglyceryl transferase